MRINSLMILCFIAVLMSGCSRAVQSPKSNRPDAWAIEQGNQQRSESIAADIDPSPIAQIAGKYRSKAFDGQRLAVSKDMEKYPQVYVAQMEPISDPAQGAILDVVLRPGVSNAAGIDLAKRIEKYMSGHFSGERTYILEEIHICEYTELPLNPQDIADNGVQQYSAHQGKLVAYISSGENDTATVHDSTWHLTDQRSGDPVTIN